MEVTTVIHQAKPCVKCGSTEERTEPGKCRACEKAYREAHREEKKAYDKAYRKAHREEIAACEKAYNESHREERNAYYKTHREERLTRNKAYHETHREEIAARMKTRRASDPLFRLKCYIRIKTGKALRDGGYSKKSSTADILGCTYEELKVHLEKQFWPDMTWENSSEWHVDHIIPLASAKTEGETLKLCHYTNLQPLWADDNLSKHGRLDWTPAESQHPVAAIELPQ